MFFSKLLGTRARQKAIHEKELITICLAVLKLKHYLLGRYFFVYTDQKSLRYIMQQREVGANFQKWVSKLMAFDFEIKHKVRSSNRVAGALSQKTDGQIVLSEMLTTNTIDWSVLLQEIEQDHFLKKLTHDVSNNKKEQFPEFEILAGRLMFKQRLTIPKLSSFIPAILKECHDSLVGEHSGELKTCLRITVD